MVTKIESAKDWNTLNRIMSRYTIIFLLILGLLFSCSPQRKLQREEGRLPEAQPGILANCDSLPDFHSLTISKINATLELDDELYDARITLHYIQDTILYFSAVNAGFEIVRVGIMPDSMVYINRIDKVCFILKEQELGYSAPLKFEDLQYLLSKKLVCSSDLLPGENKENLTIDRSVKDIRKEIVYATTDLKPKSFQFFHKKSGEYIVGEQTGPASYEIFSNYILDDLTLKAEGGNIEYDRKIRVDLSINKKKYDILYL